MNKNIVFGVRITADGRGAVVEAGKTSVALGGIGKTAQGVTAQVDRVDDSIRRLASGAATLAGIGFGAALIRDTVRAADAMTNLDSRLRLVTASTYEQARASDAVFAIAQRSRQALDATGDLYFRVAKGAETLGLSQQRIIGLTESISQAMTLSGSSAESAKAAMIQFGQALSSGVLRGEELNSVMEQAPALAEAIAKGMGKFTGELRALGEEGKLSVEEIVTALEKYAPELARQFALVTPTVSGAWQTMTSAAQRYIGEADQATGATAALSGAIGGVAANFEVYAAALSMTAAVGIGGLIGHKARAVAASVELTLATRAETAAEVDRMRAGVAAQAGKIAEMQATLATAAAARDAAVATLADANATLAATRAVGAYSYALRLAAESSATRAVAITELAALGRLQASTEAQITAATTAHTAAQNALTAATARTSAVATGAAAVMGALGGPIGLVTTALTVGVTAWALWGNEAQAAGKKAFDANKALADLEARKKYGAGDVGDANQQLETKRAELAKVQASIKALSSSISPYAAGGKVVERQRLEQDIAALEKYLKAAESMEIKAVANISEGWDGLHQTKAQQRAEEIAGLDAKYAAETTKHRGNVGVQLRLAREYAQKLSVINERFKDKKVGAGSTAKAERDISDAATEQARAYASQYEAAIKLARGIEQQADAGRKLLPVEKALDDARRTLTDTQVIELEKLLAGALLIEKRTAAEMAAVEAAKIHTDYVRENIAPLEAQAQRLEHEALTYGMTAAAIQQTALARLEDARALAAENGAWPEHLAYLDKEIEARRRIATAAGSLEALDASGRATEEATREAQRGFEQISQSLTDELMRGGKNAGDLLKDYFRTLVLRPIIQGSVNVAMGALGMGGSSGGAGGTAANPLNTASNVASLFGSGAGSMGYGVGQGLISAGNATGMSGLANFGVDMAAGQGLAGTIGGALPWIGAALAVASLLDKPRGGPKTGGDASYSYAQGALKLNPDTGYFTPADANKLVEAALKPFAVGLGETAKQFGKTLELKEFGVGFDKDPQGTAGSRVSSHVSNGAFSYNGSIDAGRDDAAFQAAYAEEMSRAMLAGLRAADLGGEIGDYLAGAITDTGAEIKALSGQQASAIAAAVSGGWLDDLLAHVDAAALGLTGVADKAAELATALPTLQQQFGVTADAAKAALLTSFNEADASAAGQSFAATLVGNIDTAMHDQYASQVAATFTQGIINPILIATQAGATLTEIMASGIVADAIDKINTLSATYKAVTGSSEWQAFKASLTASFADVGAAAYLPAPQVPNYSAAAPRDTAADDSLRASQSLLDGILESTAGVRDAIATLGMSEYQAALYDLGAEYQRQQAEIAQLTTGQVAATAALEEWRGEQQRLIDLQAGQRTSDYIADIQAGALSAADALGRLGLDGLAASLYDLDRWYSQQTATIALLTTGQEAATLAMEASYWAQRQVIEAEAQWAEDQRVAGSLRDMTREGRQLGAELLDLRGNSAGAQAALRKLAIEGMSPMEIVAWDINQAMRLQIKATQEAAAAERKLTDERRSLIGTLRDLLGDIDGQRAEALAALAPGNQDLQKSIWGIQDANGAVDASLAAVQRAVDAEKTRIQTAAAAQTDALRGQLDALNTVTSSASDTVGALKSIMDAAGGAVRKLRGEVESTSRMQMTESRAYIDMALVLVRAGGRPDEARLADAIDTVTDDQQTRYGSRLAWEEAQQIQANKLAELSTLGGAQMSVAELTLATNKDQLKALEDQIDATERASADQIKALDSQLKAAQDQVSVMRGIDTRVVDVETAIGDLGETLEGLAGARATAGASAGISGTLPTSVPTGAAASTWTGENDYGGGNAIGTAGSAAYMASQSTSPYGGAWSPTQNYGIFNGHNTAGLPVDLNVLTGSTGNAKNLGNVDMLAAAASNLGLTSADIAASYQQIGYNITQQDILARAQEQGIPAFDTGINVVPYDMDARIHKDERIFPAADNRELMQRLSEGSNLDGTLRAMISEIAKLSAQVSSLKSELAKVTDNTGKTKDALTRVTTTASGKPALLTAAAV